MAQVEHRVRNFLSDWHLWMAVAYFGIIAILVWQISLSNRQGREEAARTATAKAAASTQVGQCFTAVKNAPVAAGFIDAHEALITNSLLANEQALEVSAPSDPLRAIRVASIVRLKKADENVKDLRRLIAESTPTEKKCIALARTLGVDASRYIHQQRGH